MSRAIYALTIMIIALTPVVRSQTPTANPKNTTTSAVSQTGAQPKPNPIVEECFCESQILPEVLATVNGVTITSKDIKKATGDSVGNLQRQVIEARKRELDLMINSKLLTIEAKKRGISTTKLLQDEVVTKITRPTTAEAQTFYDQNRARINDEFKNVVEDIIVYLLNERQRIAAKGFADGLRAANETKVLVTEATRASTAAELIECSQLSKVRRSPQATLKTRFRRSSSTSRNKSTSCGMTSSSSPSTIRC